MMCFNGRGRVLREQKREKKREEARMLIELFTQRKDAPDGEGGWYPDVFSFSDITRKLIGAGYIKTRSSFFQKLQTWLFVRRCYKTDFWTSNFFIKQRRGVYKIKQEVDLAY